TPVSLAANMAVVPLSFALFFCGAVFLCTFGWLPEVFGLIPWVVHGLMRLLTESLYALENIPGSFWIVGKLDPAFFVLLTGGILFLLLDKKIRGRWVRAAALCLWCWGLFVTQGLWRDLRQPFQITVLDVGQGDAIAVHFPRGGHMLIDAGKGGDADEGRWAVAPYFKSKGVSTIDALVISHPQEDHIGGMAAVLDELKVKNVFLGAPNYPTKVFGNLKRKIRHERARVFLVHKGMRLDGFKEARILVLNPATQPAGLWPSERPGEKNINEGSVVLKLNHGTFSALFTGDIQRRAMADLLRNGAEIKADFLKVPHHGGSGGAEEKAFIEAVNPSISVISVGQRNPFGHPSPATLEALSGVEGNEVFRTDQEGAILVVYDGRGLRFASMSSP
ncbi:MAG: ComEC family DNA internalization-related competence protein, partial [Candidatus Omnitrophica bacterium]|nr:ComEC family DNA internalization-related competence protein [Candidatus Omnitrophota bacterium]